MLKEFCLSQAPLLPFAAGGPFVQLGPTFPEDVFSLFSCFNFHFVNFYLQTDRQQTGKSCSTQKRIEWPAGTRPNLAPQYVNSLMKGTKAPSLCNLCYRIDCQIYDSIPQEWPQEEQKKQCAASLLRVCRPTGSLKPGAKHQINVRDGWFQSRAKVGLQSPDSVHYRKQHCGLFQTPSWLYDWNWDELPDDIQGKTLMPEPSTRQGLYCFTRS